MYREAVEVMKTGESSNRYWALETDEKGTDRLMMFWRESGKMENIVIPNLTDAEEEALIQILQTHRMFQSGQRTTISHVTMSDGGTRD